MDVVFPDWVFAIICLDKVLDHVRDGVDRILELVERVALHGADLLLRILRLAEKIRQIQFVEVGSIAARGLGGVAAGRLAREGGELRAQVVRQTLAEDVFIECFAVFARGLQRAGRDERRVAALEGLVCFCVVFAVRDAEAVGQRPRCAPVEVLAGHVAHRTEDERQILRGGDGVVRAELVGADAFCQVVFVGEVDVGFCPARHVAERRVGRVFQRFFADAEQTDEERHALGTFRRAVKAEIGRAVGICAGALEEAKVIERRSGFRFAGICGLRRNGTGEQQRCGKDESKQLFHRIGSSFRFISQCRPFCRVCGAGIRQRRRCAR